MLDLFFFFLRFDSVSNSLSLFKCARLNVLSFFNTILKVSDFDI